MDLIQSEKVRAIVQSYREKGLGDLDVNSIAYHKQVIKELVELVEQHERTIKAQNKQLEKKETQLVDLQKELTKLKELPEKQNSYPNYNEDWTQVDKVVYIVKQTQKPMQMSEIFAITKQLEINIIYRVKNPEKTVAEAVYNAVEYNYLMKYKTKGHRGFAYILPDWLDPITKELKLPSTTPL
jgi:ABC-type Zn uptake system ZnuABC Zn-binding protein ZnuA